MAKRNPWVIGGIIVGSIAIIALVMRRKTLSYTGPSYVPTGPTNTNGTTGGTGSNTGNAGGAGNSTGITNTPPATGPVGKNAYVGQPGLIVRGSPSIDNGFLGLWGGNNQGAVNGVGTWLGLVQGVSPDTDKDKNPATGQPFNWYKLKINTTLLLLPADSYYVREDYVNLK